MTGKTILASVGEYQSEILSKFDRLIVLTPHQMVYNGKTADLKKTLTEKNIEYGNQSAFEALMCHAETVSTLELSNSFEDDRESNGLVKLEEKHGLRMRTTFCMLWARNLHFYGANIRTTMIIMALITAAMQMVFYYKIGSMENPPPGPFFMYAFDTWVVCTVF